MNPKLLITLDKVLEDVIDVLEESGWDDEAAWYDEIRTTLLELEPGSPEFIELIVELDQSFMGMGTLMDIPLAPKVEQSLEEVSKAVAIDTHHQRLGLISCASGVINDIKKNVTKS